VSDDYDLDAGPDPADFAAARPEVVDASGTSGAGGTSNVVRAVGIGPGNVEFLTPRGERAIREADVVIGFETVVEFVSESVDGDALTCGYADEEEALSAFADRVDAGETGTAVLMGTRTTRGTSSSGRSSAPSTPRCGWFRASRRSRWRRVVRGRRWRRASS